MCNGVEGAHSCCQEADRHQDGQAQIEQPEAPRRVGHAGSQPIHARSGGLGVDETEAGGPY